jgi:hypothetical protein
MTFDPTFYKREIPLGLYRHYKGKTYRVFGTVTHSESEEVMVLYAPEGQTPGEARLWVRPLGMFTEMLKTPEGMVARFAWLGDGA